MEPPLFKFTPHRCEALLGLLLLLGVLLDLWRDLGGLGLRQRRLQEGVVEGVCMRKIEIRTGTVRSTWLSAISSAML